MNTYTIRPGNIAAVCYVSTDASETTFIYMSESRLPVTSPDDSTAEFEALPLEVRAAVNKHFWAVFAQPIERRGEFLKSIVPQTITA